MVAAYFPHLYALTDVFNHLFQFFYCIIFLSIEYMINNLSICLSICLSIYLFMYLWNERKKTRVNTFALLLQVESRTRYMSVSCRKVNDDDDAEHTEIRKQSTAELPQDRVAYYKHLQGQVKVGSQDLTFSSRQVEALPMYLAIVCVVYRMVVYLFTIRILLLTGRLASGLCECVQLLQYWDTFLMYSA